VIAFEHRVKLFQSSLDQDKASFAATQPLSFHPFLSSFGAIRFPIHRNHFFHDAYTAYSSTRLLDYRHKIQIEFVSAADTVEPGIDGGGLLRDRTSTGYLIAKCRQRCNSRDSAQIWEDADSCCRGRGNGMCIWSAKRRNSISARFSFYLMLQLTITK
jgi:hypothetical protein